METVFAKTPEISLDDQGFDAWGSQGIAAASSCHTAVIPPPDWLKHASLKNPWLYAERATPNSHVAFTDVGDLRFIRPGETCSPLPSIHPAIILNRPASNVHVKLEDVTSRTNPITLWNNWFSLKNTAPGGNGIKITGSQVPIDPLDGSESHDFLPFCFKSSKDIDFLNGTKYKLTVESVPGDSDVSIKPFKDEIILRPRPLCDILTHQNTYREFLS
jgi:hypothetical protein